MEHSILGEFDAFQTDIDIMFKNLLESLKQSPQPPETINSSDILLQFSEEDDDLTVLTESSFMAEQGFGKHIDIGIIDIEGFPFSVDEQDNTFYCRIICETGIQSISQEKVEGGLIIFCHETLQPLLDNVFQMDSRTIQIQILTSRNGTDNKTTKFIGSVEISSTDLFPLNDELNVIVKELMSHSGDSLLKLKIIVRCFSAHSFGRIIN
jgi:hypothetical protein